LATELSRAQSQTRFEYKGEVALLLVLVARPTHSFIPQYELTVIHESARAVLFLCIIVNTN